MGVYFLVFNDYEHKRITKINIDETIKLTGRYV